nr:hypothetical protein [Pseudobdellovibrionaceae bacterium]
MKKNDYLLQNFSLGILVLGFLVYVAVDSNLFVGFFDVLSKMSIANSDESNTMSSSEFDLKTKKLNQDIESALNQLKEKKSEFLKIAEDVKTIESKLKKERKDLEELNQLYSKLQIQKEKIIQKNAELAEKLAQKKLSSKSRLSADRSPADTSEYNDENAIHQLIAEVSQIQNWNQVYERLQIENKNVVRFETTRDQEKEYLKFSHDKPFDSDSIYMRPTGIRFSRLIAASALSLGAQGLQVTYPIDSESNLVEEKARVM